MISVPICEVYLIKKGAELVVLEPVSLAVADSLNGYENESDDNFRYPSPTMQIHFSPIASSSLMEDLQSPPIPADPIIRSDTDQNQLSRTDNSIESLDDSFQTRNNILRVTKSGKVFTFNKLISRHHFLEF